MNKAKIAENVALGPIISGKASVSPKAEIIGKVVIQENVNVAPHVSLRADEGTPFYIGKGTNIQDGVIFHGLLEKYVETRGEKYSIYVSSHVSIAHGALVHGPSRIEKKTFIGFGVIIHYSIIERNCCIKHKTVVNNSTIEHDCVIGIGCIIDNVRIPANRHVKNGSIIDTQEDADNLPPVSDHVKKEVNEFNKEVVDFNKTLAEVNQK